MAGFFDDAIAHSKPPPFLLPRCGACGLLDHCASPKMPVWGEGRRGVLIVGDAPGFREDQEGRPFVGEAGQQLRSSLASLGVDLDRDCWSTNSLVCHTPDSRKPTPSEVDYCRPNLTTTIRKLQPTTIIPLGFEAIRSVLGPYWRESCGPVDEWVGFNIPIQECNIWVSPNYHPDIVIRTKKDREGDVVKVLFEKYLKRAFQREGRPWKVVPDWAEQVQIVLDTDLAARMVRDELRMRQSVSFDYETNRLKPDKTDAEIVSVGVMFGDTGTVLAYPFAGEAIAATREMLVSPHPKLGANTKFEDRWSRAILKVPVNNWKWDAMLSAHHLDNREGITSVKFQAFVRLGLAPWDTAVKPYLSNVDETGRNRIREVNLRSLLEYNGIDAIAEHHICLHQKKEMRDQNADN